MPQRLRGAMAAAQRMPRTPAFLEQTLWIGEHHYCYFAVGRGVEQTALAATIAIGPSAGMR